MRARWPGTRSTSAGRSASPAPASSPSSSASSRITCSSRPSRPARGARCRPRRRSTRSARSGSVRTRSCAAAVCTTMALTEWAMTSCSSRAIRSRSARTASRVTSSWRSSSSRLLVGEPAHDPAEDVRRHDQRRHEHDVGRCRGRGCRPRRSRRTPASSDRRAPTSPRRSATSGRGVDGDGARTGSAPAGSSSCGPSHGITSSDGRGERRGDAAGSRRRTPAAGPRRTSTSDAAAPAVGPAATAARRRPATASAAGSEHGVGPRGGAAPGPRPEATAGRARCPSNQGWRRVPPGRGRPGRRAAPSVDASHDPEEARHVRVTQAERRIGRFAWVMAWVGLVVGQLHAHGPAPDRRRQGGPATRGRPGSGPTRPGLLSGRCWTGRDPDLVYVTYGKIWLPGVRGVHAVRVRRAPAAAAARLREVGVAHRADRLRLGVRRRRSGTTGLQWTGTPDALLDRHVPGRPAGSAAHGGRLDAARDRPAAQRVRPVACRLAADVRRSRSCA